MYRLEAMRRANRISLLPGIMAIQVSSRGEGHIPIAQPTSIHTSGFPRRTPGAPSPWGGLVFSRSLPFLSVRILISHRIGREGLDARIILDVTPQARVNWRKAPGAGQIRNFPRARAS